MSLTNYGWLMIDNRDTPGVPDEVLHQFGLPIGSGRGLHEADTFTCTHCQGVVVINPDRTRPRTTCKGCSHLICDGCGAERAITGVCKTFKQKADELQEEAAKSSIIII